MSQDTSNHSFDDLARALASGSISRGRALRLMGAALLGGTLASLGIGEAGAAPKRCKPNGKRCTNGTECCSSNCVDGTCSCDPCSCDLGGFGTSCATGFLFGCHNNDHCFCMATTEGTTFCAQSLTCDPRKVTVCTRSQDCPPGWACAATCCNPELETTPVCNAPCGTIVGAGAASSGNQRMSGR